MNNEREFKLGNEYKTLNEIAIFLDEIVLKLILLLMLL